MHEWGLLCHRQVLVTRRQPEHERDNRSTNVPSSTCHHGISCSPLEQWRGLVNRHIQEIDEALNLYQPHLTVGHDAFQFLEIASRNTQRFDLRLVGQEVERLVNSTILERPILQGMTVADDVEERQATIKDFIQLVLRRQHIDDHDDKDEEDDDDDGEFDFDFDVSVVYSRPGAPAQGWHADGKHLSGDNDAGNWMGSEADINNLKQSNPPSRSFSSSHGSMSKLAPPYAICLFIPLIDLNQEVGCTQFWPGSHRNRDITGFGPVASVTQSTWNNDACKAGDGVWYDYRLLHQGLENHIDSNTQRPIVQVIFKKKWYVERDNYGLTSVYDSNKALQQTKDENS